MRKTSCLSSFPNYTLPVVPNLARRDDEVYAKGLYFRCKSYAYVGLYALTSGLSDLVIKFLLKNLLKYFNDILGEYFIFKAY